jgi:hypothetical protein
MGKIVRAGAGAGIFYKLEPEQKLEQKLEPDKNGPAPQHCFRVVPMLILLITFISAAFLQRFMTPVAA